MADQAQTNTRYLGTILGGKYKVYLAATKIQGNNVYMLEGRRGATYMLAPTIPATGRLLATDLSGNWTPLGQKSFYEDLNAGTLTTPDGRETISIS